MWVARLLVAWACSWCLLVPRFGGAFLGQGVEEGSMHLGVEGDGVGGLPLGVEAGEGFFTA